MKFGLLDNDYVPTAQMLLLCLAAYIALLQGLIMKKQIAKQFRSSAQKRTKTNKWQIVCENCL